MVCSVIKDLIPLYIDDCCSLESARLVEEHVADCPDCRAALEAMRCSFEEEPLPKKPVNTGRIRQWKASILQSVLLLLSFAAITYGVAQEAYTPSGLFNGVGAFTVVVPATGFMLSLINWYFIPLYKSKKAFSRWSLLITVAVTVAAFIWTLWHYEMLPLVAEGVNYYAFLLGPGVFVTLFSVVASFLFSKWYATMLGKE